MIPEIFLFAQLPREVHNIPRQVKATVSSWSNEPSLIGWTGAMPTFLLIIWVRDTELSYRTGWLPLTGDTCVPYSKGLGRKHCENMYGKSTFVSYLDYINKACGVIIEQCDVISSCLPCVVLFIQSQKIWNLRNYLFVNCSKNLFNS